MKAEPLYDSLDCTNALLGLGLSWGITSGLASLNEKAQDKMADIAARLCEKSGGEDKFLRQISVAWRITAPLFWWSEMDTYKVGTCAQSESTMHTLAKRDRFLSTDFEYGMSDDVLALLNSKLHSMKTCEEKDKESTFLLLKNLLPSGWLQCRVWTANLAVMKNIWKQRHMHRLPQWRYICNQFVKHTPLFLEGIYRSF